jgi:hypothetical protein
MRGEIFYLRKAVNLLDTELGSVKSSHWLSHRDALNSQLQSVSTYKFFGTFLLNELVQATVLHQLSGIMFFNRHSVWSLGVRFKCHIMIIIFK